MGMVVIGVFTSEFEAQAVCHRLDAEDIAARMNRQGRYRGFVGAIAVEVDAEDEAKAREILGDINAPADMDEYVDADDKRIKRCPACHSANVDMAPLTEAQTWLLVLTLGIASLFFKRDCRCRKCGHAWRG
jgi:predicted Zn-ribbon and HTH transcriptional regulator